MKSSQQNIKENKRSMIKLAISQSKIKTILMLACMTRKMIKEGAIKLFLPGLSFFYPRLMLTT